MLPQKAVGPRPPPPATRGTDSFRIGVGVNGGAGKSSLFLESQQIGESHPLDLFALFQRPQAFAQEVGHEFIARA